MRIPRVLERGGRWLNHAGVGRPPGAELYIDPASGQAIEVYFARVISTGPYYGLARVENNDALQKVRIDHGRLGRAVIVGEALFVGPIRFEVNGPAAEHVWPAPATSRPTRPAPSRSTQGPAPGHVAGHELGVITEVAPTGAYAFITSLRDGARRFAHRTAIEFAAFRVGQRVAFIPTDLGRGPAAVAVRLA